MATDLPRGLFDEVYRLLQEHEPGTPDTIVVTPQIQKLATYIQVSCCQMTDATGENHCDHPPAPRPPWHARTRWRLRARWSRLRYRLGCWVAGFELEDSDD